jgi:trehalose 6-phosphate phosphatase
MVNSGARPGIPESFWAVLAARTPRVLMLDYDGTLAPFHVDRLAARPLAASARALKRIVQLAGTRVAIVSGRPVSELAAMLSPIHALLVGEHGWESRDECGTHQHPLPEAQAAALARAALAASGCAGDRLELKRTAIALHTRGLPPSEADALTALCLAAWREEIAGGNLRPHAMNGGFELRADGHDKGSAVEELLARAGPGAWGVFVGDDTTDEAAFRALEGRGFGIRVGAVAGESHADAGLADTREVATFLETWLLRAAD